MDSGFFMRNEPNFVSLRPRHWRAGDAGLLPESGWPACRVFQTFLDNLWLICSVHGYPTQCAANTSCPRSDRFWLLELHVSQHFSTFYEPSVQAMGIQLNALPALPVRARTVSACLNSAFLGLERKRSAVGKTKAPLVAGGHSPLTVHWRKFSIKAVRASNSSSST